MRSVLVFLALFLTAHRPALAAIGDVDTAYGAQGRAPAHLVLLDDGRALYFAGTFTAVNSYQGIDASGNIDPAFGDHGTRTLPFDFSPGYYGAPWMRLPDGSTLIGGAVAGDAAVFHVNVVGEFDPTFGGTGLLSWPHRNFGSPSDLSYVLGFARQADGRILVMIGNFSAAYYSDAPRQVVVRRLEAVTLAKDSTFGDQGEALVADYTMADQSMLEAYGQKLAVLADGHIAFTDQYTGLRNQRVDETLRVPYLNADGTRASLPPADPGLDPLVHDWRVVQHWPDGSALVEGNTHGTTLYYRLFKLRPDGAPDPAFGIAGGFWLGGYAGGPEVQSEVSADGRYLYAAWEGDGDGFVARVILQGSNAGHLDTSFGGLGLVRFGAGLGIQALQGVADGSVLLSGSQETLRLLPDATPSPGMVSIAAISNLPADAGQFKFRVTRAAGSSGTLSVDFATVERTGQGVANAVAGTDFQPLSGQLTWADGEMGDKFLSIDIPPGTTTGATAYLPFDIRLDGLVGGGWIQNQQISVYIMRTGSAPAATGGGSAIGGPGSPTVGIQTSSGGGGACDPVLLLAWSAIVGACVVRRRRIGVATLREGR